jgi:multidrug efflux system membrane fusion protein
VKYKHILIVIVAIAAVSLFLTGCKKGENSPSSPPAKSGAKSGGIFDKARISYPVEVESVRVRSLIYMVNAVGSVEAFEKVQVTARVAGVVDRVLFTEGNYAKLGQVLVEIEPERYRLAVEAAQAAYEKAQASKADAEAGLNRRQEVVTKTPGLIPGEEIQTWRTKVLVAGSEVAQTKAALDQAQLNLRDAYVRAPVSGIIQTRTVQTGEYIQVGTVLATLIRRDPLLLRFKVTERDASQLRIGMTANFRVREIAREFGAKIVHIADSADEGTRMVDITAEVNAGGSEALRPGSFAEVSVPVSSEREAAVIPQTAVRPSERGFLAYVVENDTAVERVLTLGMRTADGLVEATSGLSPGENLVIRGSEALRDGVLVRVVRAGEAAAANPPEKPAGQQGEPPAGKKAQVPEKTAR